jgi:hypothetical protein
MDSLLENARRIFDIARAGEHDGTWADNRDFALLIRPDGVLHFIMESPFSIEASAIHAGARSAYRITRSREGVSVQGQSAEAGALQHCLLEERSPRRVLLSDQPLYRIASPLLTSSASAS